MFCFLSLVSAGMLSFLNQQQLAYMTQMPELQYKRGQKYLVYSWPFSLSQQQNYLRRLFAKQYSSITCFPSVLATLLLFPPPLLSGCLPH